MKDYNENKYKQTKKENFNKLSKRRFLSRFTIKDNVTSKNNLDNSKIYEKSKYYKDNLQNTHENIFIIMQNIYI